MITAENQESTAADVASVVEGEPLKQFDLGFRCMEGDTVSPGHRSPRKMSRLQTDHVFFAVSVLKIEVHQPWRPCH